MALIDLPFPTECRLTRFDRNALAARKCGKIGADSSAIFASSEPARSLVEMFNQKGHD
jgi:hypothetical protein